MRAVLKFEPKLPGIMKPAVPDGGHMASDMDVCEWKRCSLVELRSDAVLCSLA